MYRLSSLKKEEKKKRKKEEEIFYLVSPIFETVSILDWLTVPHSRPINADRKRFLCLRLSPARDQRCGVIGTVPAAT